MDHVIPTPTYVQIEPVGQCNLRCKMCPIQFREDLPLHGSQKYMDFELFTHIVDQFDRLETLHLQGLGEPLLHPKFIDMIEYAVQKGIRVTTNSNLTLLNPQKAERLVKSGLDGLFISIDGATKETYEEIRVYGHFDTLLRNIDLVVSTKEKYHRELPHLRLTLVIMRQNIHELTELVQLAAAHSIPDIFIQQLSHDFGEISFTKRYEDLRQYVEEQTLLNENPARIEQYYQEARAAAAALNVKLRLPPVNPRRHDDSKPGIERCNWPWTGAYISFQGYAMPCCMVATPDRVNFGLLSEQTVHEVWNGRPYRDFREQLSTNHPPEICSACSIYQGVF